MKHHPEQEDDEIFLGDVTPINYDRTGWKTKRAGGQSYNSDGSINPDERVKPLFVKRSEVEQALAEATSPFVRLCYHNLLVNGRI